jgi:hypothetical protein
LLSANHAKAVQHCCVSKETQQRCYSIANVIEPREPHTCNSITRVMYVTFNNMYLYDSHGRAPLDEWSARRRDLYLHRTTHEHRRHTPMLRAGFEFVTPATERPQTYPLDRAATCIGRLTLYTNYKILKRWALIKMFYVYAVFIFVFDGDMFFASCKYFL